MFFNGETVDENDAGGFSPLPAGPYRVYIDKAETKENKNGKGFHVSVTIKVVAGDYEGRLIFQNFNIENNSEKAQQIGRAQFKKMLVGIGAPVVFESEQQMRSAVTGKVCWVKVGQRKRSDNGDIENTVNEWALPKEAQAPIQKQQSSQPSW
jgi:hypothetical protein